MKKIIFALFFAVFASSTYAQDTKSTYNFLRVPMSAHAAAVGGENITIVENDPSLIFSNPALLVNTSSGTVGFNYMSYMKGCNNMSAVYCHDLTERGVIAASAQYIDYGTMKEMTSEGVQTGTFNAKDIAFTGYFSYLLSDKFSAGIAMKIITSQIAGYSSMGIGVDLGLNYYNTETEWSTSVVAKNLGGQIKAYDNVHERIPMDVELGVSKKFMNMPLRLHLTMLGLTHWRDTRFMNHVVMGADFLLGSGIWIGGGYNFRKANEMVYGTEGEKESSHAAGLCLGAGMNMERFKINLAWNKYHTASSALMINLAYTF